MLKADLVGLEGCQSPQLHLQNGICLDLTEAVALLQLQAGRGRIGSSPDQGNDRIELV